MQWRAVRFFSSVTRSILLHRGHKKKLQKDMARSFPLNAEEQNKLEKHEKAEDVELHSL